MDPRIVHDAAAQAICGASVAALALAELGLQWRTRRTYRAPSDRGTYWAFSAGSVAAILIATRAWKWAPSLSLSNGGWWPLVVGLVVFWAGVGLRWWGVLTLGRFFQLTVVVQEDHSVVERGPYRVLRHPGYAGALLIFLGLGFAYDNALGVVGAFLAALLGMLPRIVVEERTLAQALGAPYRDYMARTHRLLPGVW